MHTGMASRSWLPPVKVEHVANGTVDVKPDNILVNYNSSNGPARFSKIQLGDCGDTSLVGPHVDIHENGHIIGAAMFRSPEAMLNLRWGTATDIWSFGTTVSSSPLD